MVGRASLANIEGVLEKGGDAAPNLLQRGSFAMAPAMAVDVFLQVDVGGTAGALAVMVFAPIVVLAVALVRHSVHLPCW